MNLAALFLAYGKTPVFLAEIASGSVTYRWHLGAGRVVHEGQAFEPSPLWFDELTYSSEARKDDFAIEGFPLSWPETQALVAPSEGRTTLVLRRGFQGVPGFLVALRARQTAVRFGRRSAALVFSSWADDRTRRSPGVAAQRLCPWRVYSPECGADLAAHEVAGTASAYASGVATVVEAAAAADGAYAGGLLRVGADRRTIVAHAGAALTLSSPFPALAAAVAAGPVAVGLAPGCDKSQATCLARFDNIARFGGFPLMTDNPMTKRVF